VAYALSAHAMHHVSSTPEVEPSVVATAAHGIPAALTDNQSLQQVARTVRCQAMTLFVLAQLLLDHFEQRFLDDRRNRDARLLIRQRTTITHRLARLVAANPLGSLGQPRTDPSFAIAGASLVRRITKDAPNAAAIPTRSTVR
jgi:hypothetical protein